MGHEVAMSMAAWDGSFTVATGFHDQVRASGPSLSELRAAYVARLGKNLNESIIGFWYPKCLDRKNGGYAINFGPTGEPKGDGAKMIVTQARMVWLFARLARARQAADLGKDPGISRQPRRGDTQNTAGEPGRPGSKDYLDAADLGYRFLKEEMWDPKNGGFYWEVDATGERKLKPNKHLYGQAFALYAISEYYLASNRRDVLDLAIQLFHLIEARAHDEKYGGYVESFDKDWTELPRGDVSYMGTDSSLKLMNTHLHLLEAMTVFYRASSLPLARQRLIELIEIQSNTVVRKALGACTDKYERDWTPRLDADHARVSYGHDLENIWLLIDACEAAGISSYPLLDLYRALFDYALKFGYDEQKGGFYDSGPFSHRADNLNKTWWVQAEALVSALSMYRLTGDRKYASVFEKTYDFIEKYVVDRRNGEWYETVKPDGTQFGDKGHAWKAGYHDGRAMIECMRLLAE